MQYMLLIHADESGMGSMSPGDVASVTQAVDLFDNEITQAGQNIGKHPSPAVYDRNYRAGPQW